jgi:hypothetical protein
VPVESDRVATDQQVADLSVGERREEIREVRGEALARHASPTN